LYNNLANTKFIGKSIHFLPSCHSTNTVASDLIRNNKAVNGLIVITNKQTAGRGQQGNTWLSAANLNLTFSAIFFPASYLISDSFYLNIISSLAVAKTLEKVLPLDKRVYVKWPNDIYYGDKKLGGILIENLLQGSQIKQAVIGIGINVNQQEFPAWVPNPASIFQILQQDYDLKLLLSQICSNIEAWYLKLKVGKTGLIRQEYLNIMYWLNQDHNFRSDAGEFSGTIKSVRDNGLLVVKNNNDKEMEFSFKEIEFLNK